MGFFFKIIKDFQLTFSSGWGSSEHEVGYRDFLVERYKALAFSAHLAACVGMLILSIIMGIYFSEDFFRYFFVQTPLFAVPFCAWIAWKNRRDSEKFCFWSQCPVVIFMVTQVILLFYSFPQFLDMVLAINVIVLIMPSLLPHTARYLLITLFAGTVGILVSIPLLYDAQLVPIRVLCIVAASGMGILQISVFDRSRRMEYQESINYSLTLSDIIPVARVESILEHAQQSKKSENVAVIHVDLVGFTSWAQSVDPVTVSNVLDDVFSRFDALVQRSSAEKIKTVGDAYLVAVGINSKDGSEADIALNLAFEFRDVIVRYNLISGERLAVRVGVHFGAVFSGIMTSARVPYDIWGSVVDECVSIEEHTAVGQVAVSREAFSQLQKSYEFGEVYSFAMGKKCVEVLPALGPLNFKKVA